jgi:hypothetical protein
MDTENITRSYFIDQAAEDLDELLGVLDEDNYDYDVHSEVQGKTVDEITTFALSEAKSGNLHRAILALIAADILRNESRDHA